MHIAIATNERLNTMQAFEAIDLVDLVTVTGGDDTGTTFEAEGSLRGKTPIGIEASGQGKVSQSTGRDVALFDRTVKCVQDLKDKPLCMDILKTVTQSKQ